MHRPYGNNGDANTNPVVILVSILVIGGEDDEGRKDTVELLSLKSGTESRILGKFPKKIAYAIGTTLGKCVIQSFWQFYNSNSLIIKYKLPPINIKTKCSIFFVVITVKHSIKASVGWIVANNQATGECRINLNVIIHSRIAMCYRWIVIFLNGLNIVENGK